LYLVSVTAKRNK